MPESSGVTGMESRMSASEAGSERPAGVLLSEREIDKYKYTSLSDPSTEIRLLNILPGFNNDAIVVQIDPARLIDSESPCKPFPTQNLDNVNEPLPTGRQAYDNTSQSIIGSDKKLQSSTCEHPAASGSLSSQENIVNPAPDGSANIPHYEALSYVWGSTENRQTIHVQESEGEHRKFLVTENLAQALRHLRSTIAKRTLWIDAICINQEDMEERNTQVQRMTSIYRLAYRVVVWLGPASDSSSLAMSTIEHLGEQLEISHDGRFISPAPRAVERRWFRPEADLPYDLRTWDAVMRLFERPYFTRVWVMQELYLSNHRTIIQRGRDSMSWMNFGNAAQCLSSKQNLPSTQFRDKTVLVMQLVLHNARLPYSVLTVEVRNRDCSDERDRVYGLLGLMPKGLREMITPNYKITFDEVYRQHTVAQIEVFQRLEVLTECGPHRAIDGPSWVPNLILSHVQSNFYQSCASGISRCYVAFNNPDVAEIFGLQVGTVSSVQEREHCEFGQGIEHTKAWAHQNLDRDVYALTLCGMQVRERSHLGPLDSQVWRPTLEEWKRFCYGDAEDAGDTDQFITPFFLQVVEQCIWSRTLFIMGDGLIGLGPETMRTGDSVCVFLGCGSPIIIRQQSDGTYQVIGEAFVYALRDAYALLGPLPEPWLVQEEYLNARITYWFLNRETGEETKNDPRLGPLIGWERLDVDDVGVDDPETCLKYKNIETGEIINYDPRMSLDALKARGVELRTFALS
ncbi:hypothetical protein DHEL01_v201619 [Diaporthe helianthi]|uniref:Heterokaryon incompatibility domain-containing protein n=1 Tax=Diaporthe helianthi TaxID=158607 RepID=A0A2P5IBT7_DIAHE|nr:hypothetical protein DHEL01_v201619 [Diaporthe helianthi]